MYFILGLCAFEFFTNNKHKGFLSEVIAKNGAAELSPVGFQSNTLITQPFRLLKHSKSPLIDVRYELTIKVKKQGMHRNIEMNIPIKIGSINSKFSPSEGMYPKLH